MTTFTFSQRMISAWASWRSFLPVLFILSNLALPTVVLAQAQSDNAVYLNVKPTGASSAQQAYYAGRRYDEPYKSYTRLGNNNASPVVPTPGLGTYDLDKNSTLTITGGAIEVPNVLGYTILSAAVIYRAYLNGTPTAQLPTTAKINLPMVGTNKRGENIYQANIASADLLNGLTSGGTYTVDIQFQLTIQNDDDNSTTTSVDPNGTYSLSFYITPPPVTPAGGTTIWQSTSSSAWFTASNWSNGVPNAQSNAIIPENNAGTNIVFPILNNLARNYAVNNITLQGTTNSGKAQLTISNAVLHVYGDISQLSGGLVGVVTNNLGVEDSTQNSTLVFAGKRNQYVTGRLSVPDIIIAGSGVKSVANIMLPTNVLSFRPADPVVGVILQTASLKTNSDGTTYYGFDTTGNSLINLGTSTTTTNSGQININAGSSETISSYIKGIVEASASLSPTVSQEFGNIGLELLPDHFANNVTIQRIIGDPLIGPTTPAPGVTPVPIQRQFNIVGDVSNTSNTVTFHYLPSTYELNGITESNLTMFRTNTGAAPYTPVAGILNVSNHTITRTALPTFSNYYLTLGDKTNPLPVSLTAFTVTRSNANAVLAWTTASELGNSGFEVQVSSDGSIFRKLAFVASQNPNSNQTLNYTYTDAENGKAGVRYYRLRQIDLSGEEAFSPVRVVNFGSAALASAVLSAYPNPFADKLDFNLDATTVGNGAARVQLVDMTGRLVKEQNLSVNNASLSLSNLADLRSGFYIAKITLADGTTQAVRIQKQ